MSIKDNLSTPLSEQQQIETELAIQSKVRGYEQEETLGVTYAADFRLKFDEEFKLAEAKGYGFFLLKKQLFDAFIVSQEDSPYARIPTIGSDEWKAFVGHREKRRGAMNRAAEIGQHGEPPFRVDVHYKDRPQGPKAKKKPPREKDKERYIVRLFDELARLRHPDVAAAVQRFMANKDRDLQRFRQECHERLDELSPESRIAYKQQEKLFGYVVQDTTIQLQRYLDDWEALKNTIDRELSVLKAKQLPAPEE